ncbi:MAG: bacillithiol biosynthesis deacetylase BshB1 [Flavobacteriales bacterium]|nr:MAG: bacillithiol biosynthesis deacetylase BshB1 [Flavobacteriales bacterium]|tara:strand:+ start:3753 stop:4472 length:720 start_codon:yes stop_codon:yes gene_type:complete
MIKLDILAIGAHPDDVELGCAGTIAKEISKGKKVGIVDLTRGELGTRGDAKTRDTESNDAAKLLGVEFRENLNFSDCFFANDKEHQLKLVEVIRKYKPDLVICNAIQDRHIDHSKAAKLVTDACFLSGLKKIETACKSISQDPWRPVNVYHYIQWNNNEPNFVVDISDFIKNKLDAVMCYKSQFYNPNDSSEVTPISTKNFLNSIEYRARDLGRLTGVEYAEGFNALRTPIVNHISDLK